MDAETLAAQCRNRERLAAYRDLLLSRGYRWALVLDDPEDPLAVRVPGCELVPGWWVLREP